MAETLRVVTAGDPAWDRVIDQCAHDFYHRAAYHRLAQESGEGRAVLAVVADGERLLAWPYLERAIEETGSFDATSVYGYSGPVASRSVASSLAQRVDTASAKFLDAAWQVLGEHWSDARVVSVFTRFHPLLDNVQLAAGFAGHGLGPTPALHTLGRSVSMDLGVTDDERMAGYDKETRYEIRRAARLGLEVHVDKTFEHLGDLVQLYHQTMVRNGADERYLFSRHYFEQLVDGLGADAQLFVAKADGEVAGGLLCLRHGMFAHAHLTGIADRHIKLSPLKALLHHAAGEARRLGAQWLHLGAGRGGAEDSLFDFKRRIAPVEHEFVIGRWVVDGPAYDRLTPADAEGSSFFPAYRAPRPAPLP